MPGRNEPRPELLVTEVTGKPTNAAVEGQTMRIVERVGKRLIIGCSCGNYFFAVPGLAVCDHCGAEGDTHNLPTEGDAAEI